MSQIADIRPHAGSAVAVIRPTQPGPLHNYSDADLADEHRGQGFAKRRAEERLAAIEAELERRQLTRATGKLGEVTRHDDGLGRVDLRRLRAERPDICRAYAQPGSGGYWRSRTLTQAERA